MIFTRPYSGACPEVRVNGYKYYIQNDPAYGYQVERVPDRKKETRTFATWEELSKSLLGEVKGEYRNDDEYKALVSFVTKHVFGLDSYRTYEKDGNHYSVNMRDKVITKYYEPEKVSPSFELLDDLKDWIEKYLFNEEAQNEKIKIGRYR